MLALLALLAVTAAGSEAPKPARDAIANVVLLTLDTTRADHLGCYGDKSVRTPVLDRLAQEGARFETAFSSVPNTLPSHATILTGQYPFHTRVRDNLLYRLPDTSLTLAKILKDRGYTTLAFVSAAVLDRAFGLNQGFDVYDDRVGGLGGAPMLYGERNAGAVNTALMQQRASLKPPFFLWMHYFDPHEPYAAPAPFGNDPHLSAYDAEIAYMDHEIGALVEQLSALKLLENTLIVVVGDHGESLGEHGEKTHGVFLYDATLRVPLILWAPRRIRAGTVVKGLVRTVDLAPTILDYLGVKTAAGMDGVSLRKFMASHRSDIASIYQETLLPQSDFGWRPLFGLRTPRWRFVLAPRKELYDLQADPAESRNIIDQNPATSQEMERELRRLPFAPNPAETQTASEELKSKIASLGYVSSGRPAGGAPEIDPKDGILLLNRIDAAADLVKQNRLDQAVVILDDVLRQNPQNVPARVKLGRIHLGRRDYAAAEREFKQALQYSSLDSIHLDLALALVGLGRFQDAAEQYRLAVAMNPRQLRAYVNWTELELQQNKDAEAAAVLARAEEADVRGAELTLQRGRIAAFLGRLDDAIRYFNQAYEEDKDNAATALFFLGKAYAQAGKLDEAADSLKRLLAKDAGHAGAVRLLADIYYQEHDAAAAREYYERFLQLAPQDREAPLIRDRIRALSSQ